MIQIASIVTGDAEKESLGILIRRIAAQIDPGFVPKVLSPIKIPESKLLKKGELERAVILASYKISHIGGIIILLDCDWKNCCPAKVGPSLLRRATAPINNIPISVILAKQEFETWFIASVESLRGYRGLSVDISAPPNPEKIRGAKEWLGRIMKRRSYSSTIDQPAFVAKFDMEIAKAAPSFKRCFREITNMLRKLYSLEKEESLSLD
jgi:hypothetical protein